MMMMKRGKGKNSKLLPTSLRIISSCIKNVSTNASTAVRSAGASVASSVSSSVDDHKDQVLWAGFDKLEFSLGASKRVLLLGYRNGFQVIVVDDASNFSELVSKRAGPVTFLQVLPAPADYDGTEKLRVSRPILLVVGGDEKQRSTLGPNQTYLARPFRDITLEDHFGNHVNLPTAVRFYSLSSNSYEKVLSFQSAVFMVRCSPRIVAVGLEAQIHCFDALTLEKKFSVLTYPFPNFEGQTSIGVNTVCGPMALGPRWLAYAPNYPVLSSSGRLSPKNVTPGLSPSTYLANGSYVAHYAVESSKQLAAGIFSLGDAGYKTLSKYCGDLLPDGHNSPGWKVGKLTASQMENAGMVIVKDVVSTEVISQFRAHTSPISALSFDQSGTLLVTASIHGNNLNIYRIMPSPVRRGSGCFDWSCSHVHLYKLYRGITKAIIQDICFSHYSQWITVVSSKGTSHIFILSPFGGNAGLQTLPHGEGIPTFPSTSLPWWSTSAFTIDQEDLLPPPPVTLSVVSRIKNNCSGLLGSVNNVALSAIGKTLVPSGALVAVFHNCIPRDLKDCKLRGHPLEHLLVYTPSGFVIQYELFPCMAELSDSSSKWQSGPHLNSPEDELCVKPEPIQWWDVRRRSDSLEREECISGTTSDLNNASGITDNLRTLLPQRSRENRSVTSYSAKPLEKSHWHLSNAEVQISSDRFPIWQKSKIHFYVMSPLSMEYHVDGEFEIEQVPFHEVEIKRKDLLPVFSQSHSAKSGWTNRGFSDGRHPNPSSIETYATEDKVNEAIVICHSEPASLGSTESSDAGSSNRTENLLDLDNITTGKSPTHDGATWSDFYEENSESTNFEASPRKHRSENSEYYPSENSTSTGTHNIRSTGSTSVLKESKPITCTKTSGHFPVYDSEDCIGDRLLSAADILEDVSSLPGMKRSVDFNQYFQEGYCKASELYVFCKPTVVESNELNTHSRPSVMENPENEGLLGGMFDFSKEG